MNKRQAVQVTRYSNVARHLNESRYAAGLGAIVRRGRMVGFQPCEKSQIYLAATCAPGENQPEALAGLGINSATPAVIIRQRAVMTPCECHPAITINRLMDWEFEQ